MNMISTGAFLFETDASTKQNELVKKLTAAWEKKNSKTARAGGASLMALSLAACGGEDNTPFSAADVSAAEAAATTAALTAADGVTVYDSVDAAVTAGEAAASEDIVNEINTALGTSLTTADDAATIISTVQTSNDTVLLTDADGVVHATVDAAITSNDTAVLTDADGVVHATVDAAITSNDAAVLTDADGVVHATVDAAITSNDAAATDAAVEALGYDGIDSLADLASAYDSLNTPAAANLTPTSAAQNLSTQLTTSSDTITAENGTVNAGDVLADPSASDNDEMTIAHTGDTLASMGVISNIETITINAASTGGTFTVTDASGVTSGAVTVNLTAAGGSTGVTFSDIGSSTTVTAGTRVADLTVEAGADRSDLTIVGGTGALIVNNVGLIAAADTFTTATIDGSAGTTVNVELGAESSGITITGGSAGVDINDGDGVEITDLTLDASGSTTVTADFGDDSSNISITTGSGAVAINDGAGATVTGLTVDASAAEGVIGVTLTDGSDLTLTAGTDAGAITIASNSVSETTDDGTTVTISADAADIGSGISGVDTVNLTMNGTASTVTLDAEVAAFTASATAAAQTLDITAIDNLGTAGGSLSGSQVITMAADADDMDGVTLSSDGAVTHVLSLNSVQSADVDLSGVDADIRIELGTAMAIVAAGAKYISLANGQTIAAEAAQTANVSYTASSAISGITLDLTDAANTGDFIFTNVGTVTVTAEADNTQATTVTVDSDTAGTQGAILITGSKDIVLHGDTDASSVTSSGFTGNLTATLSATVDTITSGSGDDGFTAYDGDFTVSAGAGDDTLTIGSIDLSDDTVSISGVEVISVGLADAVLLQGQLSGTETVTGTTGTLEIEGAATDDTIDVSGFTNALTQSVDGNGLITIDAGAGADTLTGGSTNNMFIAGAGADTITAGGGSDVVIGGTGGDTIILTETTSAADYIGYIALADWAGSVGAAGGTFSGYDVITGFKTGTDFLRFDANFLTGGATVAGDTTETVSAIIAAADVSASTAASTALNDLSAAEFTDVDSVLAYINDASILAAGGTFTYTNGADELLAVTDATSGTTAIYHVDSTDATITATEVSLVATVDAILVSGDIDIV